MVNIKQLKPSTVDTLKKICTDKRETLYYMSKFGSGLEKAIASIVLAAGDRK